MSHVGVLARRSRRFSTAGLPEQLRVEQWEQHNASALVGLKVGLSRGDPLLATELNLSLPQLALAQVSGTAHEVQRNEATIARHPGQGVLIYLALRGAGTFAHRGGSQLVGPGQGIVVDADQPFQRSFARGLSELVLKIPRRVLTAAGAPSGVAEPRVFSFTEQGHDAAQRLAAAAQRALALRSTATWTQMEQGLLTSTTALLAEDTEAGRLAAAQAFIAEHAHRSGLCAADIAAAINISERQLSRIFATSGLSVPQAIAAARLEHAWRILSDPGMKAEPIAQTAARCGFSSHAQFTRTFRSKYGITPRQRRQEAP